MTQDEKKELYRAEAKKVLHPLLNLGILSMIGMPLSGILLIWIDWLICLKIFGTCFIVFLIVAILHYYLKRFAIQVADEYAEKETKVKTGRFQQKMDDAMEAARKGHGLS